MSDADTSDVTNLELATNDELLAELHSRFNASIFMGQGGGEPNAALKTDHAITWHGNGPTTHLFGLTTSVLRELSKNL